MKPPTILIAALALASPAFAMPPPPEGSFAINAKNLPAEGSGFVLLDKKWFAIDTAKTKEASIKAPLPEGNARYNITLWVLADNAGPSTYEVLIGGQSIGTHVCPASEDKLGVEGQNDKTWMNVHVPMGETIEIKAKSGSTDGKTFSRARWSKVFFTAIDSDPGKAASKAKRINTSHPPGTTSPRPDDDKSLVQPRLPDGNGSVSVTGELKQWHTVSVNINGPFAHELDQAVNPFVDYRVTVIFTHESGSPVFAVPAYFAADGNAAESGAQAGNLWRAHLSPDKPGSWHYRVHFYAGRNSATDPKLGNALAPYDNVSGYFSVMPTDKTGRDFRAHGRLKYVGGHYLRFAGSEKYFIKAGADAPETLLAFTDFDNTRALKPSVPLKSWSPHVADWKQGDPVWQGSKGKGLIGAINYLASKGANAVSFLTYNAAGDGDNVWPFVDRNNKYHYDCSKLDQWGIVFSHAQNLGIYLHFKLQENELDDHRFEARREPRFIPESMDAGATGPERKLYFREMIARYGHLLALNWNFGEENTQTYEEQRDMFDYVANLDPWQHNRVIHTFPSQQEKIYTTLVGGQSNLTGASLQNNWLTAHNLTLRWVRASEAAGRPWVVASDEQTPAGIGVPPDPGYKGHPGFADDKGRKVDMHAIRKYSLWGVLMAGGAGVEYYFGYALPENDLICEDFRSRDKSWDYCRIAVNFFQDEKIPFWRMSTLDELVGNPKAEPTNFCFANPGEIYLVYLCNGGAVDLDLTADKGEFNVTWFNPRTGGKPVTGSVIKVKAGAKVSLGNPPADADEDWLAILRC